MKRFVGRIVLFTAILGTIGTAWTVFVVTIDRRSYMAALQIPEGCDVIVCSDSQSQNALNPTFMPRLYNFSTAASLPDQNLMRLKDLLSVNKGNVRMVLIDFTPLHVGFDERKIPLSEAESARVHALLHAYHWRDTERPYGDILLLLRDVVLVRKFNELRKSMKRGIPYRSSLAGGFFAMETAGFLDFPDKAAKDLSLKVRGFNDRPILKTGDRSLEILQEQVDIVRKVGAEPVLITTPFSDPFRKAIDSEKFEIFTKQVVMFAEHNKVRYLDYLKMDFPDKYWKDANHLNLAGSEVFTKRLREDLECRTLP